MHIVGLHIIIFLRRNSYHLENDHLSTSEYKLPLNEVIVFTFDGPALSTTNS